MKSSCVSEMFFLTAANLRFCAITFLKRWLYKHPVGASSEQFVDVSRMTF